jgi:hypothetical protein
VGGAHTPFTVSQMPFFRGVISKACFFCKFFYNMSKKSGWHPHPIHGQPDAVLSGRHLKSLFFCKFFYNMSKKRRNKK